MLHEGHKLGQTGVYAVYPDPEIFKLFSVSKAVPNVETRRNESPVANDRKYMHYNFLYNMFSSFLVFPTDD
jgi:hypothetical protein